MTEAQQDRSIAATFAKGMVVLAAFDDGTPELTLAELARITGQDRATARRGALTLVRLGYLAQKGRGFRLTPKVLALAGGFLRANRFGLQVQPILNRHAAALGTEITLAVRDGAEVLLMAQSSGPEGVVSQGFTPGSRLPLLHTSLGRMLLACEEAPEPLIAEAPLPRHTAQSLEERTEILSRITEARAEGHAITNGEFESGITGYAVPLSRPGARGVVVGASRPRGSTGAEDHAVLQALQLCAAELRQSGALDDI